MPQALLTDRYTAAAGLGAGLVEYVENGYGVDIRPACDEMGINPECFKDLFGRISLARYCRLLERCAELTGDEAFGLRFARKFRQGSTGPYGYGALNAPTLGHFLRFLHEHMQYISQSSHSTLDYHGDSVNFCWRYTPVIVNIDQYADLAFALIFRHMHNILGAATSLVDVLLERHAPNDEKPFREFFGNNISFENRTDGLIIPVGLLPTPNPNGDVRLFQLMDAQCRNLRPSLQQGAGFVEEMEDFIMSRLAEEDITLAGAAQYFNVSERTLQRRLSEMHTTLNDIRDNVRRKIAEKMLAETALTATEICYRLGYSAPSAFTRSFQRWFGISPKEFRVRARDSGNSA